MFYGQIRLQSEGCLLPRWLSGKESTCNAGDAGSVPDWEDPLEKDMANHSNILAWEIPWIGDPSGLQFHGVAKESDTT